jgi:hypothetical protein
VLVARMGQIRNVYRTLVEKAKGRSLDKPSCRYEDNIKMNLKNRSSGCGLD